MTWMNWMDFQNKSLTNWLSLNIKISLNIFFIIIIIIIILCLSSHQSQLRAPLLRLTLLPLFLVSRLQVRPQTEKQRGVKVSVVHQWNLTEFVLMRQKSWAQLLNMLQETSRRRKKDDKITTFVHFQIKSHMLQRYRLKERKEEQLIFSILVKTLCY